MNLLLLLKFFHLILDVLFHIEIIFCCNDLKSIMLILSPKLNFSENLNKLFHPQNHTEWHQYEDHLHI